MVLMSPVAFFILIHSFAGMNAHRLAQSFSPEVHL